MIQFFCPDVYYWEDVLVIGKFILLVLSVGLTVAPVLAEAIIFDAKLRNPTKVRIWLYSLLTLVWLSCLLGLIFVPSAASIHLTCLKD